ncbi:hypothetical protein AMR74_16555 [Halorubrum tropicale]|uniref:Uncharacterized protein n=1 Tax=Halorubrum tropicale TaxID=1765655 RepID=A0A0M9AKG2_9EURY|nr:hypothetical protein AMR74_16555 [Halorubrum tropicale]
MGPSYRVLESLRSRVEYDLGDLRDQLKLACEHYPQLGGRTVTVASRRSPGADHSHFTPHASAEPLNRIIRLPVETRPSYQTVFHELAHLEIYERERFGAALPASSEEFTSIYTVARMPHDVLYRDDIAYLGEPSAPKDEWPAICRQALEYRDRNGANSHYIKRCREWLGVV